MKRVSTAPFRATLAAALACVVICAAGAATLRAVPWLGLTLASDAKTNTVAVMGVDSAGPVAAALGGRVPKALIAVDAIKLDAADRIEEPDFLEQYSHVSAVFADQSAIRAALDDPPVALTFTDAAGAVFTVEATPANRPLRDLPPLFWLQMVFGAGAALIGAWVWSLRPRDLAVAMFGFTGLGLLFSTASAAVYSSRELAIEGGLFRLLSAVNHLGAQMFGFGMVALFCLYPRRLASNRVLLAIGAVVFIWWAADTAHLSVNPQIGSYLPVMIETAGIFALIGVQWWINRKDPLARAALRWLGLSVVVGIGGYVFGNALPVLLGNAPSLPQGLLLGSFLLIYIGLALGLGRYRLFQLDQWAYRTVFYAGGALGVLAFDAALIFALQVERVAALGVSLLLIGLVYLPLRDALWQRLTARRRTAPDDLFGWVVEAALAPPTAREARWRTLLERLFEPLNIDESDAPFAAPAIVEDGLALGVPATSAGPALVLRFARGGRSLFAVEDLALARQAVGLLAQAEASRVAYERGASEERRRIAQDLHDDVGARLLSGLHKSDLTQTRSALREAIAEIRLVVGGLAGERRPLEDVFADLSHEAFDRLAAAGVALDGPMDGAPGGPPVDIDYAVQKALRSALREMVSNTIRHAQAGQMGIRAVREGDRLTIIASDDGVGMAADRPRATDGIGLGLGLSGLARRLESLGGGVSLPPSVKGLTLELQVDLAGRATRREPA
jgi:two-component system sensor histidine kinase DevS